MSNNERKERRPINLVATPLWKYTTIERDSIDEGGNKIWRCNFFTKTVTSSYSKLKAHLLLTRGKGVGICPKVTDDILKEIKREEDEAESLKVNAIAESKQKSAYVSLPPGSDLNQHKKRKGYIVEARYTRIFWTPCVVHSVNLAFKSICEPSEKYSHLEHCIWLQEWCMDVHDIQKFVTSVKAIFKKHTKLQLLSVAETRFASHYVVAKRMKEVKEALEQMVMDT